MKKGNLLWGLFFVIAAMLVILNQAGMLAGLSIVSIIVTLLLIPVIVSSIIHVNFWGICFPLAIIAILYDDVLNIEAFTPFPVLIAALFMSIGLTLLFPKKKNDVYMNVNANVQNPAGATSAAWANRTVYDEYVRVNTKFSGDVKCVASRNLQGVDINAAFSGVKIYFNNAQIPSGQAEVNVNAEFSGIELYVPRCWQVVNSAQCTLAGVEEKGFTNFAKANTALIIKGTARFSGITVIYV